MYARQRASRSRHIPSRQPLENSLPPLAPIRRRSPNTPQLTDEEHLMQQTLKSFYTPARPRAGRVEVLKRELQGHGEDIRNMYKKVNYQHDLQRQIEENRIKKYSERLKRQHQQQLQAFRAEAEEEAELFRIQEEQRILQQQQRKQRVFQSNFMVKKKQLLKQGQIRRLRIKTDVSHRQQPSNQIQEPNWSLGGSQGNKQTQQPQHPTQKSTIGHIQPPGTPTLQFEHSTILKPQKETRKTELEQSIKQKLTFHQIEGEPIIAVPRTPKNLQSSQMKDFFKMELNNLKHQIKRQNQFLQDQLSSIKGSHKPRQSQSLSRPQIKPTMSAQVSQKTKQLKSPSFNFKRLDQLVKDSEFRDRGGLSWALQRSSEQARAEIKKLLRL